MQLVTWSREGGVKRLEAMAISLTKMRLQAALLVLLLFALQDCNYCNQIGYRAGMEIRNVPTHFRNRSEMGKKSAWNVFALQGLIILENTGKVFSYSNLAINIGLGIIKIAKYILV